MVRNSGKYGSAGLATGVGSIPIFFTRNISRKLLDALLGGAAGVMLAATSFSLIVPAIEKGGGSVRGATITLIGILCGGIFLDFVDKFFPDSNLLTNSVNENESSEYGFMKNPIGIGFQNLPEGLAVALPLVRKKYSAKIAFLIALATGLVEPIGGLVGVGLVQIAKPILPFALAFAAGAMLFVISHEIIPETQNHQGHSKLATHALLIDFVIMMFLDTTLG